MLLFGGLMMTGWQRPMKNERIGLVPVGWLSGFLHGSTGIPGPPVVLFLVNQSLPKRVFRANINGYFFSLNAISIPWFTFMGLMDKSILSRAALLVPGLWLV